MLDVGDENTDPRLHLSEGKRAQYIALSHCWGKTKMRLRCTKSNIDALLEHIPLEDFPANFRDAIFVARALGMRYIWIGEPTAIWVET